MFDVVRIPEDRIAILIGKDGGTKRKIEKVTKTKIEVNDGVEIDGDSLEVLKAKQIVTAIGRGFSPYIALKLMDDDFQLIIISLQGETVNTQKRLMSRIIGTKGKCKNIIEKFNRSRLAKNTSFVSLSSICPVCIFS